MDNANEYYYALQELGGSKFQMLARNHLLENEDILKNEYQKQKNKIIQEDTNSYYTFDIKQSSRLLIKRLLYIIRKQLQEQNIHPTSEEEYQYLKNSLTNIGKPLENSQKNDNIKILSMAKNFFDTYNTLDKLTMAHNLQLKSLWLEDLSYNMNPSPQNPNDIGVNTLLSKENLEKISTQELSVLNLFWQNKYAKELIDIGFGYFAFQQLDLYDKLQNDSIKIDDNTMKNIILKYNILQRLCEKIYNMKIHNKENPKVINNLADEYKQVFSSILPDMLNDLHQDLEQCINRILASKNTYAMKSNLLCGNILDLVNNKKLRNWGYINDNDRNDLNSFQSKNKYILIGIDYPGLNRPVKIHVERELLQQSLIGSDQLTKIPIYEGENDFRINYEQLPTHIVLPLEKRHKEFLRNRKNISPENFKYTIITHMQFLANQDKFPIHLKGKDGKRKRKFIDVFTGETYIENGKTLIPENPDNKEER